MGHLISEPKFKITTPPPPLLISDKSLKKDSKWSDIASLMHYCIYLSSLSLLGVFFLLTIINTVGCPNYQYSRLSLNGHLYKTDTSVKWTLRVGPCISLLLLFDSL